MENVASLQNLSSFNKLPLIDMEEATNEVISSKYSVCDNAIIFLLISLNKCFGCSKEPSRWDDSFEYPQYMFQVRNKKKSGPMMENVASLQNLSSFNKLPLIDMEEANIEVGANP